MAGGYDLALSKELLDMIDKADKSLAKLATTSENTQKKVFQAFQQMSQGSTMLGNAFSKNNGDVTKTLRVIQADLAKYSDSIEKNNVVSRNQVNSIKRVTDEITRLSKTYEELNRAQNSMARRNQNITFDDAIQFSKNTSTIEQDKQAIKRLQKVKEQLSRTDSDYASKLLQLNKLIKEHQRNITIAEKGYKALNKAQNAMMGVGRQLGTTLASVFSIQSIVGYAQKVAGVRGEFEMYQRTLQAILQNKDEADALFNRTVELAVQSPFRVKDLVSYTKQLAAYRIESEKLYDTNKMLADISAGLGVDMQRLILAYGQVRSAAYLRGTELRQFTEAGIPILEELSKYFTELEGRAISVGEVFEMVSKRMVLFEDVDAVLKRMTGEGGTFYRMQEIQSETLKGQWSNLLDAIDIMLNEVGKANEDTMKGMISSARRLLENWEDVAFLIERVVKSLPWALVPMLQMRLATSKIAVTMLNWIGNTKLGLAAFVKMDDVIKKVTKSSRLLGTALSGVTKLLGGAAMGLGIFLLAKLATGLTKATLKATELDRIAKKLKKSLGEILTEDSSNLNDSVANYGNLVQRLEDANIGSKERLDIISKLNAQYGEYLDFVVDENTTIEQLSDSYEDLVKRMKEKASLSTYEKGLTEIANSYRNSLKDAKDAFYELFEGASIEKNTGNEIRDTFKRIIPEKEDIDNIYAILQQRVEKLNSEEIDGLQEQQALINDIVKTYFGEDYTLVRDYGKSIDLLNILVDKKEKEKELQEEIDATYQETLSSREANLRMAELEIEYSKKKAEIDAKQRAIDTSLSPDEDKNLRLLEVKEEHEALQKWFELEKIKLYFDFGMISESKMQERKDAIINWATDTTLSVNNAIDETLGDSFSKLDLSKVKIDKTMQSRGLSAYLKEIEDSWKAQNEIIKEQISLIDAGIEPNQKQLDIALKREELYRKVAEILGIELKYTERLDEETRSVINSMLPEEYQISLEQAYLGIDGIIDSLTKKEKELVSTIGHLNEKKESGLPFDAERLRMAQEEYIWVRKTRDLIDESVETPISATKVQDINEKLEEEYRINTIDSMESEVKLLEDANKEKEKAIAYEAQLLAMQKMGVTVTDEELELAKKDIEQWTLRWKLLGGIEAGKKTPSPRDESLMEERVRVVKDMADAYNELNQSLSKTESLEGAFVKYKDAYQKAFAGTSLLPKNFADMTANEFLKTFDYTTEEGIIGFFDKIIPLAKKTSEKVSVELAKGDYILETRIEIKTTSDEELKKQVDEMFAQYDLSLELDELGIPKSLAKDLFDIDYTSLDELKEAITSMRDQFIGTNMEETYNSYLEKINEMEDKAAVERMKTYSKYLLEGMSERVKLKVEEMKKLKEIEESKEFTPDQKKRISSNIQRETKEQLDKQEWEEFRKTPMYTMMFEDLESMGTKAIDTLKNKLNELKGSLNSLDPDDMREIMNQLEKIEDETIRRNPFEELKRSMEEIRRLEGEGRSEEVLQEEFALSQSRSQELQKQIDETEALIVAKEKGLVTDGESLDFLNQELAILKEEKAFEDSIGDKAREDLDSYIDARKALNALNEEWETLFNLASQGMDSIKSIMESLGVESDSVAMTLADASMSLIDLVAQGVSFYAQLQLMTAQATLLEKEMNTALGPIGWVVLGLQAITTILQAIFGSRDKMLQKQVEDAQYRVERLQKAFSDLEKEMDNAWSINQISSYNKMMEENLRLQIEAQKAAIRAQEQRKGANKVGSEEYKQLQEMKDALAEMETELAETWEGTFSKLTSGVLDGVHDAAREFTDVWYDAFVETGDGLQGLEDNFKEMLMNMAKQQATMQITGAFVDDWKKSLEKYINEDDTKLTADEAKAWAEEVRASFPELNSALEAFLGVIHEGIGQGGSLSTLEKGIQGITESTAEVLASYLNSLRFYVADSNSKLTSLVQNMVGGDTESPMITELKAQTKWMKDIHSLLSGLTATFPNGGRGFKVVM